MFSGRLPRLLTSSYAKRSMNSIRRRPFSSEIRMLEQLLEEAKARTQQSNSPTPMARQGPKFNIQTFNAISPVGLRKFDGDYYKVGDITAFSQDEEPHVIMLRSHKLKEQEVSPTVRCIARCGAGTNNIPVEKMTSMGIPVFNTPGANANAVKEAVICALFLSARGIHEGIRHTNDVIYAETKTHAEAAARIEKDKKLFVGVEITGRTLGVIGLGHIGGRVVEAALALGMNVIGFDPALSLDAAWKLPGDKMEKAKTLEEVMRKSDFISLHVPYMKETHHLIGEGALAVMKPNGHLINFSRGELVDSESLRAKYDAGELSGKYVSDFADEHMQGHPRMIMLPHLGASTAEAEENSAAMASDTIQDFLTTGAIRNSVNFPTASLPQNERSARFCIVNKNTPGVLGNITTLLGEHKINIASQLNVSRGDIAYTVVDMEDFPENPKDLQRELGQIAGVVSSRFIGKPFEDDMGNPGTFYNVYV